MKRQLVSCELRYRDETFMHTPLQTEAKCYICREDDSKYSDTLDLLFETDPLLGIFLLSKASCEHGNGIGSG